jgi:TetR/AcrR family transcriptional regulator, cholesterol catabolism regulator
MQRRRDATRVAILRAAGRIFRERGFAETAMRDIAAGADLSVANLYLHFSGKDEILFFCQDRSLDLMLAAVAEAKRLADGGAAGKLRHVLRAHADAVLDEVEGAVAHVATEALSDPLRTQIVAKRDRYERALRALVAAGVANGEFVSGDVPVLTRAMLGALNWTATWFRPEGERTAAAVADTISDYLIRGLSAPANGRLRQGNGAQVAATKRRKP